MPASAVVTSGVARRLFGSVVLAGLLMAGWWPLAPAQAAVPTVLTTTTSACSGQADAASCDVDGDRIPDTVETVVCGSSTCATGREDSDTDGIPDWTEVRACGSASCADPGADADRDGVPDFAEVLVCGSATCSNGHEDSDGNGIADWIDYVICGTAGCATGQEDFDGNGVADAAELAACVKQDPAYLAYTGFQAGTIVLAGLVLVGGGLLLMYRRRQATTAAATALTGNTIPDTTTVDTTGLDGLLPHPGTVDGFLPHAATGGYSAGGYSTEDTDGSDDELKDRA